MKCQWQVFPRFTHSAVVLLESVWLAGFFKQYWKLGCHYKADGELGHVPVVEKHLLWSQNFKKTKRPWAHSLLSNRIISSAFQSYLLRLKISGDRSIVKDKIVLVLHHIPIQKSEYKRALFMLLTSYNSISMYIEFNLKLYGMLGMRHFNATVNYPSWRIIRCYNATHCST